jgi:hypothetical protein
MPRFALLEHRRDGIHYDFLLETAPGGPLRTWAIDAEVVAGKDLPARALADHRALYLDYEGEVSGGRGTVRRLDGGEFETIEWADDRVRVRLAGGQLVGEVEVRRVVFEGEDDGLKPAAWVFRLGNFN